MSSSRFPSNGTGANQVYGINAARQFLNFFLPLIVMVLRFGGVLFGVAALLTVHFIFGQAGFALAIRHGVDIWVPLFGHMQISQGLFAVLLEVAAQAIQIVLWDKMLHSKKINKYMKPLFLTVMSLLVLVNISVVTALMFHESTLNIFPSQIVPAYLVVMPLVALLSLFDSYFIAKAIETLQHEGDSALFGSESMKRVLGAIVLFVVSLLRMTVMIAGTLALLAVTFIFGEVAFTLFFQFPPGTEVFGAPSVHVEPGVFAGLLSMGVVGISVVLAEVIVHKRDNATRLLKASFGAVVIFMGLCSAAVVPWIMYRDSALNVLPAAGHFTIMYMVVALLAFLFTIFDSYFIIEMLESLKDDKGDTQPPKSLSSM